MRMRTRGPSVRVPRVGGCMSLQGTGPALEYLVSPGDTLLTSQNVEPWLWVPLQPPCPRSKPGPWWGGGGGFRTFLILWLLALVATLWPAAWSCVCETVLGGRGRRTLPPNTLNPGLTGQTS